LVYFLEFRRVRDLANSPVKPAPSRVKLAGSGMGWETLKE
jgi:hypothetical protein